MSVFLVVSLAIELILWLIHLSVTVFIGRQLLKRNGSFTTGFYMIYFVQNVVDLINYFLVSIVAKGVMRKSTCAQWLTATKLLMGNLFSFLSGRFCARKEICVLIEGTSAAGKTSVLHKLKFGNVTDASRSNLHPQVETIHYNDINFTFWDVGCATREYYYPSWREYFEDIQVVLFVFDSTDKDFSNAREELTRVLAFPELRDAVLLVLANKQDRSKALSVANVTEQLKLHKLRDRTWCVQATSAISGQGLYAGLNWISGV